MVGKIEFTKTDDRSLDGSNTDTYSIDELFSKLQSMRLSKTDMEDRGQLQSYGYTDCINDILEWVQSKRK